MERIAGHRRAGGERSSIEGGVEGNGSVPPDVSRTGTVAVEQRAIDSGTASGDDDLQSNTRWAGPTRALHAQTVPDSKSPEKSTEPG
jgi:hypothetical protein